jgi:hypothetical protein
MTWTLPECLSYIEKSKQKVVNDAKILSFIKGASLGGTFRQPGLGILLSIHYTSLRAMILHDIVFLR